MSFFINFLFDQFHCNDYLDGKVNGKGCARDDTCPNKGFDVKCKICQRNLCNGANSGLKAYNNYILIVIVPTIIIFCILYHNW